MTLRCHFPPKAKSQHCSSGSASAEKAYDQACQSGFNCGRHETRYIESIPVSAASSGFPFAAQGARITKRVEHADGRVTVSSYVLVTSHEQSEMNALDMLLKRRGYWGIEMKLHYPLDVSALEDKSRVRLRNNAVVLALMRRAAVSIASAWKAKATDIRRANLPGFFDAIARSIVTLLTTTATAADSFN